MLTTRSQKFLMFCIGFFALVLGAVMLVPFKSVCKADNMLLIEAISKLIVIPILIILLSIYPNKLKYIQVKGYREQSRIVSVLSYFPAFIYLGSLIIESLYLLTQGYVLGMSHPLGLASWNLWFVALLVSLVLIACAYAVLPKYEMQLNVSEHVILDVCLFILVLCFGFMYYIVLKQTNDLFMDAGTKGDKFLLVVYLAGIILFVALLGFVKHTIQRDEVNVNIRMNDLDAKSFVARVAEYNRAYNDIMDNFENYFTEEGSLSVDIQEQETAPQLENVEEADVVEDVAEEPVLEEVPVEEPAVEEAPVEEPAVEEAPAEEPAVEEAAAEEPAVEEAPAEEPAVEEAPAEEPVLEETPVKEPAVEESPAEEPTVEEKPEPEVVVVQSEELEEILTQIVEKSAQAALLEAEIEQIKQEKIEAEQQKLAEEAAKQQAKEVAAKLVEEKALQNKAEMQPSFKKLVSYTKALEGINVIEDDAKNQVRFLYGKKAFLVLTDTPKDYRIVFMADPMKVVEWWNQNPEIRPRSNKKDNWFKLTNKGSFTEELLLDIIKSSREFVIAETERVAAEKAAAKEAAKEKAKAEREAKKAAEKAQENKTEATSEEK